MKQKKFTAVLYRAVGIPVVALAVFTALLLWEIQFLKASLSALDRTDQVIIADRELIKQTIDMDSGVRGYLNTGREDSLQPYKDAALTVDSKFAALDQLVSGEPAQRVKLAAIQSRFDEWRLLAALAIESHRSGTESGEYQQSVAAGELQRKLLMDSIRSQHQAFAVTEDRLRSVFVHRARGDSRLAIITSVALTLVGGSLLALFIRRQMHNLLRDFKASLNISENRAEALREQAELLDLAYDTIMVRDINGKIRFWNHGAERMYGYSKQQATGRISHDLLRTVFPLPLAEITVDLLRDGRWEGELTRTTKGGSRVIVASRWVSQHDGNGRNFGVMEISSDITALRRSEEALHQRELLLAAVAEQAEVGLGVISEERRYLYSNPAHAKMLGLSSEQVLGRRVSEITRDLYNQVGPRLDVAFTGEQIDFEITIPRSLGAWDEGHDRSYAVTYKPLQHAVEGRSIIAVVMDITDRKRGEEDLRSSQERLSAIVGMAMDAVITLDESHHIVLFNAAAERIFGCQADEAIGQLLDHFIPAENRQDDSGSGLDSGNNGTNRSMHSHGLSRDCETNYGTRKNGEHFPLEATISQMSISSERFYTVILRDISERKHAEEKLREEEERFRTLYEYAAVGIEQVALDGTFLSVNPALRDMMGYSESELRTKTSEEMTHPEDRARESALLMSMLAGDCDSYEIEKRYLRRDGATVWVNATSSLVKDVGNHQRYRISIIQDVSRRKRAEDQLQQAQKMEAIGRLAGGIAHDFNNLLSVILGYSELAIGELPNNDLNRSRFQEIETAAKTGAALTKQLLAFSRKQVIAIKVVDLKETVMGMERMLRRLLPEDIEIIIQCVQKACPVKADPSQLKQVLINLAVNAGDAMQNGGFLTIDVRSAEGTEGVEQSPSMKSGPYEMLTVSDSGIGMDAETVAHIFEPFFTTKSVGEGTGLGLATVYGIVKRFGGAVVVSSKPGAGSVFKVLLPRSSDPITTKTNVNESLQKHSGNETILLVDDSPALLRMTRQLLTQRGYSVLEAADGLLAWELSKNFTSVIHLLITDIVMPRMGGTELAEHIVQERPDIALLFISGYATDKYAIPHNATGKFATIEKPFSTDEFLGTVRRLLDGKH